MRFNRRRCLCLPDSIRAQKRDESFLNMKRVNPKSHDSLFKWLITSCLH